MTQCTVCEIMGEKTGDGIGTKRDVTVLLAGDKRAFALDSPTR